MRRKLVIQPKGDLWSVRTEPQAKRPAELSEHETRELAIAAAQRTVGTQPAELIVRDRDGRVVTRWHWM
jgi:hypothetical protein